MVQDCSPEGYTSGSKVSKGLYQVFRDSTLPCEIASCVTSEADPAVTCLPAGMAQVLLQLPGLQASAGLDHRLRRTRQGYLLQDRLRAALRTQGIRFRPQPHAGVRLGRGAGPVSTNGISARIQLNFLGVISLFLSRPGASHLHWFVRKTY